MALRHDAFISYSHAVDGKLAAALEHGLEKLAKPLLKLRALDVFRDQTSLSASPALWPGIVAHLEASEWFVLLASPASAASVWCNKEVSWWLEHRSANRMLVLLTEGDILWDPIKCDFDWSRTTAVPRILEGRCEDEPLYVDVRWTRNSELMSLRSAQFRDVVVNVAAPIRGVPKDELDGADLRQLARNRLLVRGGVAAITLAAGIAIWQAFVANQQRLEAERQRDIAVARQLAAQAELMRTQQPDRLPLALLMATESARSQPDSIEAQQTLRGVLSLFPLPTTVLRHASLVESAVFSPDMTQIATAAEDGGLWKLPEAARVAPLAGASRKVGSSSRLMAAVSPGVAPKLAYGIAQARNSSCFHRPTCMGNPRTSPSVPMANCWRSVSVPPDLVLPFMIWRADSSFYATKSSSRAMRPQSLLHRMALCISAHARR